MSEQVLDDFIAKVAARVGNEEAAIVERRIRLVLQDKPEWWPEWAWRRVVSKLLRIEIYL